MQTIKTSNADINLLNFLSLISNDRIQIVTFHIDYKSIDTHISFNNLLQEKIVISNLAPPPECIA